ncbi:MAG: hypothetical protein KBC38_02685 [Candidatus Pacebacteria bacterium]|nr:hypothetical protein [Candidatus Paceibacterota bacterium]MBP9840337.1 hypothetical protein [Candidatus Paceibacterota bacterium]
MISRPVAAVDLDALYAKPLTSLLIARMVERDLMPEESLRIPRLPDAARLPALGRALKGVAYDEAEAMANELTEEHKGRVFPYVMGMLLELKSRGYFLLAISGAPRFLVDGFAYEAGFDKSYGSFFATGASERFTGAVEDEEVITNRGAVLQRAVRKEKLVMKGSVGLAASASFIPVLEMVENPLVFNPDHELRAHAEKRGWKVVLEEDGTVYKL